MLTLILSLYLAMCVSRLSWYALFWPVYVCDRYLGRLGRVLVLILHKARVVIMVDSSRSRSQQPSSRW